MENGNNINAQEWVWQSSSKKRGGFLARETRMLREKPELGRSTCMLKLCLLKDSGLVAGSAHPHAINDADPDVCQGSNGHTVGLALSAFALVVGSRPGFLQCRLPGKLVQMVAQWLQAGKAFVGFSIIPTLERNWSSACQFLHTDGASR